MPNLSNSEEFIELLISVENPRSKGRNKGTGRFHSFQVSDDEWNVGYGHRVSGPNATVVVNGREIHVGRGSPGLTEAQARQLLKQDIAESFARAKRDFNNFNPYQDGTVFEELDETQQMMFTEIAFNTGSLRDKDTGEFGWPNLSSNLRKHRDTNGNVEVDSVLSEFTREGLEDRNNKLNKFFSTKLSSSKADIIGLMRKRLQSRKKPDVDIVGLMRNRLKERANAEQTGVQDTGQTGENQEVEQEEESIKLEPGVYERADGSLFEVNRNNEVVEKGNGPSQTSQ